MKYQISKQKGFTLIELLVVISIISLLSTVVLASLSSARNKAYDAKVSIEKNQIITTLESFYADHGGYPYVEGPSPIFCVGKIQSVDYCTFADGEYIQNYTNEIVFPEFEAGKVLEYDGAQFRGYAYQSCISSDVTSDGYCPPDTAYIWITTSSTVNPYYVGSYNVD